MKHYEHLWEEAEKLSGNLKKDLLSSISEAVFHLNSLKTGFDSTYDFHMGMAIFNLCAISNILNINTYTVLQKIVTDKTSELLES